MSAEATLGQLTPSVWDELERRLSPIDDRPRMLPGFVSARHQTRRGEVFHVVSNPRTHEYVKLDEREFSLLPLMDGTRTLKAIAIEDYETHGSLAFSKVAGLAAILQRKGFLSEPWIDAYAGLEKRVIGFRLSHLPRRVLHVLKEGEIAWTNVDPAFAWLYRHFGRFFFTRTAAVVGVLLGIAGIVAFFLEFARHRYPLFQTGDSFLAGVVLFLGIHMAVVAVHEFGHAMAVKNAGQRVHQAGFMLYFGLPVAWVDTTDIWLAPRRQRLMASFAGPWTGLVIGAFAGVLALALPESDAGAVLFTAGLVCIVNTSLNFNPLVELDGYYLLVDLLERPMLRARAIAFVRGPFWAKLRRREPFEGTERLFAVFGLASIVGTVAIIAFAAWTWQERLWPIVQEAWDSGDVERATVIAVAALAALFVAVTLAGAARNLWAFALRKRAWARRRADEARYHSTLDTFRRIPLWAGVPAAELVEIARETHHESVRPGTAVVRQGDPGSRFYLVDRGEFEVIVDGEPVSLLRRGDYFGERALLQDAPRAATVVARTTGSLLWLDREAFDRFVATDLSARERISALLDIREHLQARPLFRDLSPAEMDLLFAKFGETSFRAGETIVREGDPADLFYVIKSGRVAVSREGKVVNEEGPGDVFGEISLIHGGNRRATVSAIVDSEFLTLTEPAFREVLGAYCGRGDELRRLSHLRLEGHQGIHEVSSG